MDKLTTSVVSTRGPPPKDGSRLAPGSHLERCGNKNTPTAGKNFVLPQAISLCFAVADGTKRRASSPRKGEAGEPGREPANSKRSTDVCFGAHSGLKSDVTALPKCANRRHLGATSLCRFVGVERAVERSRSCSLPV